MNVSWNEEVPPVAKGDESARDVFLAWEKLRIVYNAVLAAVTLIFGRDWLGYGIFSLTIFTDAAGTNVYFCAGPVAEGYLHIFGMPRKQARIGLFVAGTLLAVVVTLVIVVAGPGKLK